MNDITHGGFIEANIRNAVIRECLESGDAENYFRALRDVVEDIEGDWRDDPSFWDRKWKEWGK